jgi:putative SOS response-associated peptidase YedK
MPVILDPDDYEAWLTAADTAIAQALLQPFPAQLMTAYPVSKRVTTRTTMPP